MLTTLELINNGSTLESIGKRQSELTRGNAEIFDWAMKTLSGKMKVSLPNIQIYDFIPYTIVPKDVIDPFIPFTNPNELVKMPFFPIKALPQDETHGTIKMSQRTPEEIEKYRREQAQKAKSLVRPKKNKKN